jgi:hypothetical protein
MTTRQHIQVDLWPESIDEFVALRDRIAQTPFGGAAAMVLAMLSYTENEELGRQCLTAAVDQSRLEQGLDGYKGWRLRTPEMRRIQERIRGKGHILRSYIQGATPENGYRPPPPPWVFEVSDNPYSGDLASGTYKVFVASSGAASPRPVTLKRNNRGLWKASEWSSLTLGVREAERTIDDDL